MEQIEVQIEIEPENIDGIIEHTAEAHAWISGNLDGYVHIWKVDLSFTNLKEKIYFSIPSTQMQHDKALEIELYTHSQNTQEDDSNSVMKRSAGVACFALFHLLSHKNKELRHELITYGTNAVHKGYCSVTIIATEAAKKRILGWLTAAPIRIDPHRDNDSDCEVRLFLDDMYINTIDCNIDPNRRAKKKLWPLDGISALAGTILPSVLTRAGPVLPCDFFAPPWNTSAQNPPAEELWVQIIKVILWEEEYIWRHTGQKTIDEAIEWLVAHPDDENVRFLLCFLVTYDATCRHYRDDILFDNGDVVNCDTFSNVFVEGDGDCEDLSGDVGLWVWWLRESKFTHPLLVIFRNLLKTALDELAILCDVTSAAVNQTRKDCALGAHMVFALFKGMKSKVTEVLMLEATGRCHPASKGVNDKARYKLMKDVSIALGEQCSYYKPITIHLQGGGPFYRYFAHAFSPTGKQYLFCTGSKYFGAKFEHVIGLSSSSSKKETEERNVTLRHMGFPPASAIAESKARMLHTHPIHIPPHTPITESDTAFLSRAVLGRDETITLHTPLNSSTDSMRSRARKVLQDSGFEILEEYAFSLFPNVGQHYIKVFKKNRK